MFEIDIFQLLSWLIPLLNGKLNQTYLYVLGFWILVLLHLIIYRFHFQLIKNDE